MWKRRIPQWNQQNRLNNMRGLVSLEMNYMNGTHCFGYNAEILSNQLLILRYA